MILYENIRTGIFHGFIEDSTKGTIEAIVEKRIIGETYDGYITEIRESSIPMWDDMGKYDIQMCSPVYIHKSRLIKWTITQLELF